MTIVTGQFLDIFIFFFISHRTSSTFTFYLNSYLFFQFCLLTLSCSRVSLQLLVIFAFLFKKTTTHNNSSISASLFQLHYQKGSFSLYGSVSLLGRQHHENAGREHFLNQLPAHHFILFCFICKYHIQCTFMIFVISATLSQLIQSQLLA